MRSLLIFIFVIINVPGVAQSNQQLQDIITAFESQRSESEDLWPMNRTADLEDKKIFLDSIRTALDQIEPDSLNSTNQINMDMLELIVNDRIYQLDFQSHTFPLNAEGGFLAGVIYSTQGNRINNQEDLDKYIKRLKALPQYFDQRMKQMRLGQSMGKSSPKLVVNNCIALIDQFLDTPIGKTFLDVASKSEDQKAIRDVIASDIRPAYLKFKEYLKVEYLVNAPEAIGISKIKDGKAFYEDRVRFYTTFDITPKEVFDTGLAEVKRIRAEMESIITELGFEGNFADFFTFLRTDEQFYAQTPQALLDRAAWITTKAQGQLPNYFNQLPRMPLDVVPVPDALAPNYTGGRYSPGSYRNHKAGQYWVNTYNLSSRPLYVLPALTLHEGVPGHHLQGMLAQEIKDMPRYRQYTYLSAFGEGWGLYAEHLGQEMGIYTTPYEQFGRLTYEMWRACRLVVDPGMHYMGWTREMAYDFMASNTALSIHEVNTEINRYIGWPGQAVSYKMGELKIKALRKMAEDQLGDQFDIRSFHDALLKNGSVPLNTLERIVKDWIEQVSKDD